MNLLQRLFRRNMVDCPRCLGKGQVDLADIKRLKKEIFWIPGKCAYCNGLGKVPPNRLAQVPVDMEYLTTDLSSWERNKVINGDADALKRANETTAQVLEIIKEIEHLYYIENLEFNDIADYFFKKHGHLDYSPSEKQEMIDYVERVIKSKLER